MRDSFDRILTSVPVNKTAAQVTAKGEHYEPKINYRDTLHSDVPLPIMDPPKVLRNNGSFVDLTGHKSGRLIVLGLWAGGTGSRWVVRCACGDYEVRTAKALRNTATRDRDDKCARCDRLVHSQWVYREKGSKPIEAFKGGVE